MAVLASLASSAANINLADVNSVNQRSLTPDKINTNIQRVKAVRGSSFFFEDFQTQADPENPVLPAGWALFNLDGLTPNAGVAYVTDAWIVRDDFINAEVPADFAIFSTSWYTPAGTSDDWIITPMISLPVSSDLSWLAFAPDANYSDGYEVYVSRTTQDVTGCQAGGTVFSIAGELQEETPRTISLSQAGFMNEDVYICFRNNSTDKFLLVLDDIMVDLTFNDNIKLDAVAALPEYTQVPDKLLSYDIPLTVDFTNIGSLDQSDILVEAEIFLDMAPLTTVSQVYAGPLLSGDSGSVDLGSYTATAVGVYDVVYNLTLDGVVDENPADNTVAINAITEITTDTMSRDDAEINTGTLGIGAGSSGFLGNEYEFNLPVTISGVQFIHDNDECPAACVLDGETLRVDVFMINTTTGLPDMLIGSSVDYVVPAGPIEGNVVDLIFPGNLNLAPGAYVFALTEPELANVQIHTTENRFTPDKAWVLFGANPWSNNEDFGFNNTFYMRPKFVETDLIFKNGF